MNNYSPSSASKAQKYVGLALALLFLGVILGFLFKESFKPEEALFANDGPLGVLKSDALKVPGVLTGFWMDLSWIGMNGSTAATSITYLALWFLGPVGFAKFYGPFAQLLLGICAWAFFRTLKLPNRFAIVAALAAALNTNFFSNTCWGLGTRSTSLAATFLALAVLNTRRVGNKWLNAALAGLAVGVSVIEGADNGVIFSLFVAAFVLFQAFVENETARERLLSGARLFLVVFFSMFIAVQVLIPLMGIASKGSSSIVTTQEPKDPVAQWDFATQWSLPPLETLRVIVPGLFGYRMDTPEGGEYWGRVGEQPGWEQHHQGFPRHSGAGEYAGVLVVLVAIWALAQSLRRGNGVPSAGVPQHSTLNTQQTSPFTPLERKYILFWAVMGIIALVFAWGRHAPFYHLIYPLPFFKSIRNPMKFMHPSHLTIMILFGYGLLGLSRRYLSGATAVVGNKSGNASPPGLSTFEKRWAIGCIAAFVLSLVILGIYASSRSNLVQHLMNIGYPEPARAGMIASHSISEVGKFVLFLLISITVLLLIQFGVFAGPKSKWAAVLLGVVVTVDLARADKPWIMYYDYKDQYATNPVLDMLRDKPWEHRVTVTPQTLRFQDPRPNQQLDIIYGVYLRGPWLQYHFQYYNVQALDMAQEPRPPADKIAYLKTVGTNIARYWQLTNTRYILGLAGGFADLLNQQFDPVQKRFRQHTGFNLTQVQGSSNIGAQTNDTGPWALIEFNGALPRAKVYTQWQVMTNNDATLAKLADPAFDPAQTLLLNDAGIASIPPASTNPTPGTVEFASYSPKEIQLNVNASVSSILLLNDKYDPDWKVWVDGKPAQLLRCNFLMRGVQVPAGASKVRFHFEPSLTGLKVTLVAIVIGIVLCSLLFVVHPPELEQGRGGEETETSQLSARSTAGSPPAGSEKQTAKAVAKEKAKKS